MADDRKVGSQRRPLRADFAKDLWTPQGLNYRRRDRQTPNGRKSRASRRSLRYSSTRPEAP